MQRENNGPAHITSNVEVQPPTALSALLDRIANDPHRRTAAGVAFSPEVLGLASWYRVNDRAAFDTFNGALSGHLGATVFQWRKQVVNAPPLAPANDRGAPPIDATREPVNDPAPATTSARFDDPDDVSDETMARRATEDATALARYFADASAAIGANDRDAARRIEGPGARCVLGAPDVVARVLRTIGKGRAVDAVDLAAARATLARGPGAADESPVNVAPAPTAATSWAAGLGLTERVGADAAADAREAHRDAARDGAPDPLDGLPERITTSGNPALAFDPLAIGAALDLRDDDGPAFQSLRGALKRAGVTITEWSRALDAEAQRRKRAAKEAERERLQRAAAERRAEADAARAAVAEKFATERGERPELAAHFNQAESNGATFTMEPGRVVMDAPTAQGTKRTTLANFSPPIVAHTLELDAPDAKPRGSFVVSVVLEGSETPREGDVEADRFDRMDWIGPMLGPRAVVAPGKGMRDNLRAAIGYLSSPVTRYRYGFTGWVRHEGRWVYLHAGGAIGVEGVVEGLAATPPTPVDRFALPPPPTGDDLAASVDAVVLLLSMEPAAVTVPMVALAFHAPLGGSRLAVHVNGPAERGKTVRASLVQRLYGAAMNAKAPPASWADGSTAIGIGQVLARAGDALVTIDDLRIAGGSRDESDAARVDRVLRAHFNGASPLKGRREGGAARVDPASRCNVLSTGETLPKGPTASTLNRVVTVELDAPLPANVGELDALASAGVLAGGMAAFLRWLAPQLDDVRATVRAEERAAALRWGFTAQSRATELLGGLCLGMEFLLRFLRASGVPEATIGAHWRRAREALHEVAGEHGARVADEGIAPRFVGLIGQALRSGLCNVVEVVRAPRPMKGDQLAAPDSPGLWGYQMVNGVLSPRGRRIGYLNHREPGAVCLEPAAAVALAKQLAREGGQNFGADKHAVGAALHGAGMLARTELDGAKARPTIRPRVMGSQPEVWAVKLSALGYGANDDDTPSARHGEPDDGTGPAPEDVVEFPADIDPLAP